MEKITDLDFKEITLFLWFTLQVILLSNVYFIGIQSATAKFTIRFFPSEIFLVLA